MVYQPEPPKRRSLTDDELTARIQELQRQPDGLVAAMELIEEQTKLREIDALEQARWELDSQMSWPSRADSPEKSLLSDPATPKAQPNSEIDIFADVPKVANEGDNWPPTQVGKPDLIPPLTDPAGPESKIHQPNSKSDSELLAQAPADTIAESLLHDLVSPAPTSQGLPEPISAFPLSNTPDQPVAQTETFAESPDAISESLRESYLNTPDEQVEALEPQEVFEESVNFTVNGEAESRPVTAPVAVIDLDQPSTSDESLEVVEVASPTRKIWSLVWSWASFTATPLTLVLAAYLKVSGASFAQALFLLAAVLLVTSAISAVGAVAAKRASSGLGVVGRAAFGVWGNGLPATLMLLVKLAWVGLLVSFAARIVTPLIYSQPWFAPLAEQIALPAEFLAFGSVALVLVVLAAIVASFGGITLLRSQQVATAASLLGIIAIAYFVFTEFSLSSLSPSVGLAIPELADLAGFVIAILGFYLFSQSGDYARKLSPDTPGAQVFFITFVSILIRPLLVGSLGLVWIYLAGDEFAAAFSFDPLSTVAASMPIWIFVCFAVAIGLSVIQLIANSLYSLAGDLFALAVRTNRVIAQLLIAFLVSGGVLTASYLISLSAFLQIAHDGLILVAVIAAGWSGILVADSLIRRTPYHEVSLTRDYGFYGRFNWVNLLGFAISITLGLGYLAPNGVLTSWTGFLAVYTPGIFEIVGSNIGIAMSFGISLLVPVLFGIPNIRAQEANYLELEQRRQELKEFLDTVE